MPNWFLTQVEKQFSGEAISTNDAGMIDKTNKTNKTNQWNNQQQQKKQHLNVNLTPLF